MNTNYTFALEAFLKSGKCETVLVTSRQGKKIKAQGDIRRGICRNSPHMVETSKSYTT